MFKYNIMVLSSCVACMMLLNVADWILASKVDEVGSKFCLPSKRRCVVFQCTLLALFQSLTTLRPPPIYLLANMSSPSSVSSATLPFIADETQPQRTSNDNPDPNSSIGHKSKFSFKAKS